MNLTELEQLCLYHVSESLDESNVIDVYIEANDGPQVLEKVIEMCYDVIQSNFARVSRSAPFCALSQPLMLKIIERVVPKLNRLNSEHLNSVLSANQNDTATERPETPNEDENA